MVEEVTVMSVVGENLHWANVVRDRYSFICAAAVAGKVIESSDILGRFSKIDSN